MKVTLIKADKIDAAIDRMHTRGQNLQKDMHRLACSVLVRLGETGDVRQVMKFILAMPDMARTNGLRNWFEQFGPIKFQTIGEGPDATERAIYVKNGKTRLGDGMAKPFWKFSAKEGAPYEALDIVKWANATIKRLEKDAKETGRDHTALISAVRGSLPKDAEAMN